MSGNKRNFIIAGLIGALCVQAQSEFSKAVQADLLLTEAKGFVDVKNWRAAAEAFKKMGAMDVVLPDAFHYFYGMSLCRSGSINEGLVELMVYLMNTDGDGVYQTEAIELLVIAKNVRVDMMPLQFPEDMDISQRAGILIASIKYNETNGFTDRCLFDYELLQAMDVELPDEFYFLLGRVHFKLRNYEKAQDNITYYINKVGQNGDEYHEALKLILECKKKIN